MTQERRRHPRHPIDLSVEVSASNELLVGETLSLSLGGTTIVVDDMIDRGATVWLTFGIPHDAEDEDDDPFESSATVRWTRARPDGRCLLGLQFGPLTAAQKRDLARLLASRAAAG